MLPWVDSKIPLVVFVINTIMNITEIIRATANTTIYLDLDGVLADFFAGYKRLNPSVTSLQDISPAKDDPALSNLIGTNFYYTLPKYSSADELIRIVLQYVPSYNICSSPLRGDHENAEANKRKWIGMKLTPKPKDIIITSNKQKYAVHSDGTPNILIDDKPSNITRWNAAGGIGILYNADVDRPSKVGQVLARIF